MSIIAGEISTGKTSVLEFADWCLGAKWYPDHDEIVANVRSAQLSLEIRSLDGADQNPEFTDYVIERPLGPSSTKAWLYEGDFTNMSGTPVRSFVSAPDDPESLSQYLLQLCGLAGLRLRAAPTQEESDTSVLSFRDIQPLWFLTNRRMDNGDLALEHDTFRSIKLVQVVDLLFGVTDDQSSTLARQVEQLSTEARELRRTLTALSRFLEDAGFETLEELDASSDSARVALAEASAELANIDKHLAAQTQFAATLRREHSEAMESAQALESELRDRRTLSRRLDPLRAQYADELRRLELVSESFTLFDSLLVAVCPACQSPLHAPPTIVGNRCTLCHSHLVPWGSNKSEVEATHDTTGDGAPFDHPRPDLSVERGSIARRLNQLKGFAEEVRTEAEDVTRKLVAAQGRVEIAQRELDLATRRSVAPFLAQRDQLTRRQGELRAEVESIAASKRVMRQLRQKDVELRQVEASLKAAKERQKAHSSTQSDRQSMLARLANRMESILRDFGYPKVDLVTVSRKLVPSVRGKRYDRVGSSGAMTLIALAWTLAIFELSVESGEGHPGFLLIDSPQKNLLPGARVVADADHALSGEIIRNRSNIVLNVYDHLERWLARHEYAQVILVDNDPPETVISARVVRYSGDASEPPYGLIDNEDGSDNDGDHTGT